MYLEHMLAEVRDDGLPTREYNNKLSEFDHELHQTLERDSNGQVIVVETFGGKRTYYGCVGSIDTATGVLDALTREHPQHELSFGTTADHSWKFYRQYRDRFEW